MAFILALFWFVQFTNKLGSTPIQFSERATENRLLWSIPTDSLDYSVSPDYINQVRATGARVCHVSRWMNGLTMEADSATMQAVSALPCVQSVELTRDDTPPNASVARRWSAVVKDDYTDNGKQLNVYNLRPLHQLGFEGQGIRIAVIDGGFWAVDTATCFNYIRERIVGTYDYSADSNGFYSSAGNHGAYCLSFIGGKTATYHGAAIEAEYILIRTEEVTTESPKEMDNLVAALEVCDSLGVNVISCSLGYRLFDNPSFDRQYSQTDGRTTRVSRAAAIAARKGMLLCFSAGNDGQNTRWNHICFPGDADSILTVGAVATDSVVAKFSSYGPSADGRVKPEVCAVGEGAKFLNPQKGTVNSGNGTSFSTPLVAGLAASLWSAMPQVPAQQIRERIIRSAHLYPSYDPLYQMGYGIPDAVKTYEDIPSSLIKHPTKSPIYKTLHNGQIVIYKNGKTYNLMGLTF